MPSPDTSPEHQPPPAQSEAELKASFMSAFRNLRYGVVDDPEQARRIEIARRRSNPDNPSLAESLHDPLEDEEPTATIIRSVLEEVQNRVESRGFGRCHSIWREMKEILRTRHGIVWYSPAEMNPTTRYD